MGKLKINNMRFYAYHGCLPFEKEIGNTFLVSVVLTLDTSTIEQSDNMLDGTDYSQVYKTIAHEMKTPSLMIEHIARRILNAIKQSFHQVTLCEVEVVKLKPPIDGDLESVSITIEG